MSDETRRLSDIGSAREGKEFFETEMKEENNSSNNNEKTIKESKEEAFKDTIWWHVKRYEKGRKLRKKVKGITDNIRDNIKELLDMRNKESHETEKYKVTMSKQSRLNLTTDNLKDVLSNYLKDDEIEEVIDSIPTVSYDRLYITNRNDEHEKEVINFVQDITKEI